MSLLHRIKQFTYPPRLLFRHWMASYRVGSHNPGCYLDFPIQWDFDDVRVIRLAPDVRIGAFSEIVVRRVSPKSRIEGAFTVGEKSIVGVHANIRAEGGQITIGRQCILAQGVSLIGANHAISLSASYQDLPIDETRTGVTIEDNVWIASHVCVLPGCTIGGSSIIGAGSVVTRSIPPGEIWAGVPARKLRAVAAPGASAS